MLKKRYRYKPIIVRNKKYYWKVVPNIDIDEGGKFLLVDDKNGFELDEFFCDDEGVTPSIVEQIILDSLSVRS